jgi:hypothetical protein
MKPIRRILFAVKDPQARQLPAVEKAAQLARELARQAPEDIVEGQDTR